MRLLVGLGNPGAEYARSRHNVGFMALDEIVRRHGFGPWRSRFQGQAAEGTVAGEKVLALKPETYMNLSGQAAAAALRFYKMDVSDVVVLHDDLDLAPGRIRVKKGGGSGGHNGLKSLDAHIGAEYRRVRLGIGHPGDKALVTSYVLGTFDKADQDWLGPLIDAVAAELPILLAGEESAFTTRLALVVPHPKHDKPGAGGER